MKYRYRIYIVFVLMMLAVLAVLRFTVGGTVEQKRDMVSYNDRLYRVYDDYLAGLPVSEIEQKHGCKLLVNGTTDAPELNELYAGYALVMDFTPNGETVGKIGWNDVSGVFETQQVKLRRMLYILWGLLFAAGLLFLFLTDHFLLKPTRELREYAGEIAKGNFDVPLPIRKHNPFGSLTEAFDIMREELRASKEREAEAEKAKKELVAELAHDIKTPVATIQATCEVMELKAKRGTADAADIVEKVQTITAKTETIRQLMDNVFQTTLEELDRVEVTPREENTALIEEYFRNLKNYGTVLLENAIPSCLVYMDKLRMEQVIDNVVGNSHKYAGTDIHVRFDEVMMKSKEADDVAFVRIRIADEGPGVSEEELPLLMQKYYRGSAAKGKTGFGLGLYLVRSYMEKQGGGAEVYNDGGFVVELYLKKV
ncbi:MAG: HAMP domain-containing histidine kinase [Lachnospiraceae bacterium]|nr:HAMP domain-containing histidine kinase [Lachnospiraceae bacterium]